MKVVLYTNIVSPHQLPLAFEIQEIIGPDNYRYVSVYKEDSGREKLGWAAERIPAWVIYREDTETCDWLESADVLISGQRDMGLFERRASKGLRNFYMSERWFKPPLGVLRLLHPLYFMMAWRMVSLIKKGKVFYLPIGVYAARDMTRLIGLFCGSASCAVQAPGVELAEKKPLGRLTLKPTLPENVFMRMWGYFVEASPSRHWALREKGSPPLKMLWVGRMLRWKRVDTIIHAVQSLLGAGEHISLAIVGLGPEENALKQMAGRYLKEATADEVFEADGISFCPPVPIREIRPLMRRADVYVLASDGYEGWGAVVNEAMAEGCCVIGTREAGSPMTMIEDGVNGLLFDAGDTGGLVCCVRKVMDAAYRQALAQQGKQTIDAVWSPENAAKQLLAFCESETQAPLLAGERK